MQSLLVAFNPTTAPRERAVHVMGFYQPAPEHEMFTRAQDWFVSISVSRLHRAVLTVPSGSNSDEFKLVSKVTLSLHRTNMGRFQKHTLHTASQGCSQNNLQAM